MINIQLQMPDTTIGMLPDNEKTKPDGRFKIKN